ncbi:hypothetical protein HALLA_08425 [Halostagnicola larsenii XH-48]|uniref:Beta-lactamase n=1 Tax=Halostagnicola larsenii XH-48 TaxID=797299 RepID=W0JNZ6_9EURY|nr:hypothetical protein [Halostagnicola larsenii]AHF98884.1 hypothetical protein HALLA_08425 [Halostagnicola larsenii XH-48]
MTSRVDERAADFEVIDRFDGGVGWIAHPDERMRRASHALEIDGNVWVIDPVDADGIDELFAELGTVAGVVTLLDRHKRDAATIANRHGVEVYLPDWFEGVAEDIDAPIVRFGAELADTGLEASVMRKSRFWQEVALYNPADGTLVVPESVGGSSYFLTRGERLGVHPVLRAIPPREQLGGFDPDRVLVGHGSGVLEDADAALEDALRGSRRRIPWLYGRIVWNLLPV